jgi:RND family efflux transporter MFP subunit
MSKIKQFFSAIGTWWKTRRTRSKVLIVLGVIVVLLIVFHKKGTDTTAATETVKRQNIEQTVLASGTVVSSTDLSLSFEQNKVVTTIAVRVGDTVKKGAILARVSGGTESAAVKSARGSLLAAQARYKKVLEGNSDEQIAVAQTNLANARRKLYSDDLVADPEDDTTLFSPVVTGIFNGTQEGRYNISFKDFNKNNFVTTGLEKITGEVDELPQPLGTKGLRIAFPAANYDADDTWNVLIPNTSGVHYAANLNAYQSAEAELAVQRATARQPEIDAALADIVIAQASLDNANANLEKTILRAPADGTVTRVNIKIGEVPEANKEAIGLQDVSNLYLEAKVNETSVPHLVVGQPVTVTFDAFGNSKTYTATLSSIDPAATITDGIVNYEIKALLSDTTDIKPGMTANMTVLVSQKDNVLAIPLRAVINRDNKKYVRVITDAKKNTYEEREISTGLEADEGLVEAVSGLHEGERVVTFIKK